VMAQAGTTGHLRIGERAFVGARAGLHHDVPDGARVFGSPATEERSWHRSVSALKRLPDLLRRVRRLERATEADSGDGSISGGDSDRD
jgi:UDP-3-O-[3-hydroxymyristoyl] glucosamine N-acyltransferase